MIISRRSGSRAMAEAMAVAVASVAQEVKMISLGYSAPSSAAIC